VGVVVGCCCAVVVLAVHCLLVFAAHRRLPLPSTAVFHCLLLPSSIAFYCRLSLPSIAVFHAVFSLPDSRTFLICFLLLLLLVSVAQEGGEKEDEVGLMISQSPAALRKSPAARDSMAKSPRFLKPPKQSQRAPPAYGEYQEYTRSTVQLRAYSCAHCSHVAHTSLTRRLHIAHTSLTRRSQIAHTSLTHRSHSLVQGPSTSPVLTILSIPSILSIRSCAGSINQPDSLGQSLLEQTPTSAV
jgi:hypothetical protein